MRGAHPKDADSFSPEALPAIREAALDLRYLYGRGYSEKSAIALTGDRYQLTSRQRQGLYRAVCAPELAETIARSTVATEAVADRTLLVDGHNVLITVETALAGGVILQCDDGFMRDIAERHGAYRENENTKKAFALLDQGLAALAPDHVACFLDKPLPFSGELAARLRGRFGDRMTVDVVDSPDHAIRHQWAAQPEAVVASSDSIILQHCGRCFDLAGYLMARWIPDAWHVAL